MLGDGNGITVGKATTNVLSIKGKNSSVLKVISDLEMIVIHSDKWYTYHTTTLYTSEMVAIGIGQSNPVLQ